MKRALSDLYADDIVADDSLVEEVEAAVPTLPLDVWRLIFQYSSLQLLFHPVCRVCLSAITELFHTTDKQHQQQGSSMIQQWICDVADARFFNTLSLFELVEQRQWCLQLRGIPDIVDLSFCRDLQRIIDGKIWLDAYWNRENDKDNITDSRRRDIAMPASSYEIFVLPGDARHCIKTAGVYMGGIVSGTACVVYGVSGGGGIESVVRYLRWQRDWSHLRERVSLDCQLMIKNITPEALHSLWLKHCEPFASSTELVYNDMVARGEKHWMMGDDQMASDVCHLMRSGLLVVDGRGTRNHAPHTYSEDEWTSAAEENDDGGVPPLRAYVRLYAPRLLLLGYLFNKLPPGALWCPAKTYNSDFYIDCPYLGRDDDDDKCLFRYRRVCWPYMGTRENRIPWERETYGLDRLPGLLDIELVEIIDQDIDRPDGYLFTALAAQFPRVLHTQ